MKITHNQEAPTGALQVEPTSPFKDAEIRAGLMMGIGIRSALNPNEVREMPVPMELGLQITQLILDYSMEQVEVLTRKLEENEAQLASREALSVEKGGVAV